MESSSGGHNIPKIMVFRPTWDEFKDFPAYISYMESQGAHKAGVAKIIPPKEFVARRHGYDNVNHLIPEPISQVVVGCQGLYTQYNIQKKKITVKEYEQLANSDKYRTPKHDNNEELERKYWKNITFVAPIYGADVCGTLYDDDQDAWNIGRLGTILDCVEEESGTKIAGVNTPYLYFGMWKSTFGWHTEDMDLYSINYIHYGAPKTWYSIPPEHGCRLERLAQGFFPGPFKACPAFLRHKMTLMSPNLLRQYSIPVNKITHCANEFMVTFPYAYHAGFNHGYNAAESTNFASVRWIEYGKRCQVCKCRGDMVKIHMDLFIRKFQPDRYELWKQGKDFGRHPEDDTGKRHPKALTDTELTKTLEANSTGRVGSRRHPISIKRQKVVDDETKTRHDVPGVFIESPTGVAGIVGVDTDEDEPLAVGFPKSVEPPESVMMKSPSSDSDAFEEPPFPLSEQLAIAEAQQNQERIRCQKFEAVQLAALDPDYNPIKGRAKKRTSKVAGGDKVTRKKGRQNESTAGDENSQSHDGTLSCEETSKLQENSSDEVENIQLIETVCTEDEQLQLNPTEDHGQQFWMSEPQLTIDVSSEEIEKKPSKSSKKIKEANKDDPKFPVESQEWAKALVKLWQWKTADFAAEAAFNELASLQYPHCCVCACVTLESQEQYGSLTKSSKKASKLGASLLPRQSRPHLTSACYKSSTAEIKGDTVRHTKKSHLIVCDTCKVCVHASCYGTSEKTSHDWKCRRCEASAATASCCLCRLRGGALKQTTCNQWAHVTCALIIPEVTFMDTSRREPIDVTAVSKTRTKMKCAFCGGGGGGPRAGACVVCSVAKCRSVFHVTCGVYAGVVFTVEQPSEAYPFDIECNKCHADWLSRQKQEALVSPNCSSTTHTRVLSVGDIVLARHKRNLRYYYVPVAAISNVTFYSVDFDDGSFSTDLYPGDIVKRDCESSGVPGRGERVEILWTDGQLYGATFREATAQRMYTVKFDDNTESQFKRNKVWHQNDKIPKHVLSKISVATERKYDFFYCETVEGSRQRKKKCPFEVD